MVALYYGNRSQENAPVQLFAKLVDVELSEDPTPLGEEHGVQDPFTNLSPYLQIHSMVFETDADGDDGYYNIDPFDHEINSDPNIDKVPNEFDDENTNDDENVNASLVGNPIRRIVIHNNPGAHMSLIDPDLTNAVEFSKYPDILPAHRLVVDFEPEEFFVGQKFKTKEKCIFSIK
ncbi:hypothetical protein GOBAR_AA21931 [Gossypium barbadense]|uniref:Uncharacterized protein n=1 Tax=Gossypium barbadense TaxID=3634 RepID=A0A2P5X5W2_GOSBA|nr:hypothetical protein GOBAR_AA21931 [Gossypium barbadense]